VPISGPSFGMDDSSVPKLIRPCQSWRPCHLWGRPCQSCQRWHVWGVRWHGPTAALAWTTALAKLIWATS
jgi:hypothetical protein